MNACPSPLPSYYHRSFRQLSVAASLLVQHCKPTLVGPLFALCCTLTHTHTRTHTPAHTHPHKAISFEWKWVLIYMALFIIQWQIQQLCQFLPIFHFQYSFNAVVDIAVARSLLSLPVYKIHFKTCVRGWGRAMWALASSCFLLQLPVAVASCHSSSRLLCARVKKQWAIANYLTPFQHADTCWPPLYASFTLLPLPLPRPACQCASCCMRRHFLWCCKAFAKFSLADLFVSFIARGIQISIQSLQAFHTEYVYAAYAALKPNEYSE